MNGRRNRELWERRLRNLKRMAQLKLKIFKGYMFLKIHAPQVYRWLKAWEKQNRKLCKAFQKYDTSFSVEGESLDRMAIMYGICRQRGESDEQLKTRIAEKM